MPFVLVGIVIAALVAVMQFGVPAYQRDWQAIKNASGERLDNQVVQPLPASELAGEVSASGSSFAREALRVAMADGKLLSKEYDLIREILSREQQRHDQAVADAAIAAALGASATSKATARR